jgi:hypothetical protein
VEDFCDRYAVDLHFLKSFPLFLYVSVDASKTASAYSYLPSFGSRHKSLVTARKSDPVSNKTLTGVSSDPRYIVPIYPAPSSFVKSTLNPPSVGFGVAPFSKSSLAFSYFAFSSADISLYLISFNFF